MSIRQIWLAAAAVVTVLILAATSAAFKPVNIKDDGALEAVLSRLAILFVLSIFVERTVQVYVSIFRNPRKQEIESQIRSASVTPVDAATKAANDTRLVEHQAGTQQRSVALCLVLGLAMGLSGVSVIEAIVDNSETAPVNWLLRLLDILIVGGLLAGGSQPIHQIMETITDTFALTRKQLKVTTDQATLQQANAAPAPAAGAAPAAAAKPDGAL